MQRFALSFSLWICFSLSFFGLLLSVALQLSLPYHSRYLKAVDLYLEIIVFYANYFPCTLVIVDQFLHNFIHLFVYISASVC